uniref:AMP-dependent synthetase/ligase domain-containing protein n=1 Tax=Pinguiococcus pyrenoidosus TaxID=172671 RepID=A0A7R9U2M5_9STRA
MDGLLERLSHWVQTQPEKDVLHFCDDRGAIQEKYSYAELAAASDDLAQRLLEDESIGLSPGDRALLVYLPGLDFLVAFLACLKARIIAVPVFPPDPSKLRKDLHMFCAIHDTSGATTALTSSSYNYLKKAAGFRRILTGDEHRWPDSLRWVITDTGGRKTKKAVVDGNLSEGADSNDVAFLQFTSGSTSEPKGVQITFGNLAHNLKAITTDLQAVQDTVVVSWLPQYHDMGLIGAYLGILFCGGHGYYMSPLTFIKRPVLWMELISKYRGTHMQAPNFTYILCARKFKALPEKQRPSLDLSCVRHMINAAEPVTAGAIEGFYDTFASYGLGRVVFPTYGLAEHTVFVCSGGQKRLVVSKRALENGRVDVLDSDADTDDGRVLVGCGYPGRIDGLTVAIVDLASKERKPAGDVGEIWLSSPSKARGYWGRPDLSEEDFHAQIQGEEAVEGGFLRTGDLGFMHDGELYITGRQKDLIIVRGRNHYPQDIEMSAEGAYAELRPGCSAAFHIRLATLQEGSEEAGTDAVAYVAEVREVGSSESLEQLAKGIQQHVASDQGVSLSALVLLKPRTVPKTSSGKIARRWCKRGFEAKTLEAVYEFTEGVVATEEAADAGETKRAEQEPEPEPVMIDKVDPKDVSQEEILEQLGASVKRIIGGISYASVSVDDPLTTFMDSMAIAQVNGDIGYRYDVHLPDEFAFQEHCTLRVLSQVIKAGGLGEDARNFEAAGDGQNANGVSLADDFPCLFLCCPCLKPKKKPRN